MRLFEVEKATSNKIFTRGMLAGKMVGRVVDDVKFIRITPNTEKYPSHVSYMVRFYINKTGITTTITYDFDHMMEPRCFTSLSGHLRFPGVGKIINNPTNSITRQFPPRVESSNKPIEELKIFLHHLKQETTEYLQGYGLP